MRTIRKLKHAVEPTSGPWKFRKRDGELANPDGKLIGLNVDAVLKPADAKVLEASAEMFEHARWVCRLFGTDNPQGIKELKEHIKSLREAVGEATLMVESK